MREDREQNIYIIFSLLSGILALAVWIHLIITHPIEDAVGERFVLDQFTYPTFFYTFHFKPITLFVMFGLLWWVLGLEGWRRYIVKIPQLIKRLIIIFFFLSATIMLYEFLQNFFMWTSFYILYGGNIDQLCHQLNSSMPRPVNFNFVSKLFLMFLSGALYGMYFFNRIEKIN
ncbi:hypothetical protein [[Eubacterium] cellulosolvens]